MKLDTVSGNQAMNRATGGMLVPLHAELVGQARSLLPILFAATGLVLIIGCANAATLISTRALARKHEFLLRLALGGSRTQLLRQVAAESFVLAAFGGLGGLLIAYAVVRPLRSVAAGFVPRAEYTSVDPMSLMFSALLILVTTLLCGISPALSVARGLIIGVLAAAGSIRLMRGLIFGVTPGDPWSFAIATSCLLIAAFVARAPAVIPVLHRDAAPQPTPITDDPPFQFTA